MLLSELSQKLRASNAHSHPSLQRWSLFKNSLKGQGPCAQVLKKNEEVVLSAKAFNMRVIAEWLASELRGASAAPRDDRIPSMSVCLPLCGMEGFKSVSHVTITKTKKFQRHPPSIKAPDGGL